VRATAARLAVRVAGLIEPARAAAWWADILYVQSRDRSGVREAASCLAGAPWLLLRRAVARRGILGGLACVALVLLITTGLEVQLERSRLDGQLDAGLAATAQSFRTEVAPRVGTAADLQLPVRRWLGYLSLPEGQSVLVSLHNSPVYATGQGQRTSDMLLNEELFRLLQSKARGWQTLRGRDGAVRALTVPIKDGGGTLVVTASRDVVDREVAGALRTSGTAAGAGLLVTALLLLLWARRVPPTPAPAAEGIW
jgi:hypothetical protein